MAQKVEAGDVPKAEGVLEGENVEAMDTEFEKFDIGTPGKTIEQEDDLASDI